MSTFEVFKAEEHRIASELEGKRLICELSFDKEQVDDWRNILPLLSPVSWKLYPSLCAVTTVGTGIYYYDQGDFWSSFESLSTAPDQVKWGGNFEAFLLGHESLETFNFLKDRGALRYVAPILAHGGVPLSCLPDLFTVILKNADTEGTGQEFLEDIENNTSWIQYCDKPVQRFLKYGGEVAEEFISRLFTLWNSRNRGDGGGTFGLPERVVDEFVKWLESNPLPTERDQLRFPRPELRFDPDDLSVGLFLPKCDGHPQISSGCLWDVNGEVGAVTASHLIPVSNEESWEIKISKRTFQILGLSAENQAIFFDASNGKHLKDPERRRLPENLWAIFHKDIKTTIEPYHQEPLPYWPDHVIAVFDLGEHHSFNIADVKYEIRRPFFFMKDDPIVLGAKTQNNLPVFNDIPSIDWEGKANLSLEKDGHPLGNKDIESKDLNILIDDIGIYTIGLRGPLGQNVFKKFAYLPNFILKTIPFAYWPDTDSVSWDISCDGLDVASEQGFELPIKTKSNKALFTLRNANAEFRVFCEIPTLSCELALTGEATDKDQFPLDIDVRDLHEATYPRLICNLGHINQDITLHLKSQHNFISPPQGRTSAMTRNTSSVFDLRVIRDLVEESGHAEEFNLAAYSRDGKQAYNGHIMTVRPFWDVQDLTMDSISEEEELIFNVQWKEPDHVVAGRWIIIAQVWSPFDAFTIPHLLEKDERGTYSRSVPMQSFKAGRYIVKAVHAPFGSDDLLFAQPVAQTFLDVNKADWRKIFCINTDYFNIETYLERVLTHWYNPALVSAPNLPPSDLSTTQMNTFFLGLAQSNKLEGIQCHKGADTSLPIFYLNPVVTTKAIQHIEWQSLPKAVQRALPPLDIIHLTLNETDKHFLRCIVFQYSTMHQNDFYAGKDIKQRIRQKNLSPPLREMRKALASKKPNIDTLIFLCAKHNLFKNEGPARRREYKKLRSLYFEKGR